MKAKQGDSHVHELQLGTGETLTTGPPIEAGGEPAPEVEAIEPVEEQLQAPEKRRCLKASAEPKTDEGSQLAAALAAGDPGALPAEAKAIWLRMFKSSYEFAQDKRYSAQLAWGAVREEYGLGRVPRKAAKRQKIFTLANTAARQGAAWVVHITGDKNADVLYERTEQVPLPSASGAFVTIGLGPGNHRNILTVTVPARLVSEQAGAAGPIKWVHRKADEIWRVAKGSVPLVLTKRNAPGSLFRFKGFYAGKASNGRTELVTDPRKATKRIAYGPLYVPWMVDKQGEFASPAEIERWAHQFVKRRGLPGIMHAQWQMPDGSPAGEVVESGLARPGDLEFPIPGTWWAGTEYHPKAWKGIRDEELVGYSIGGRWGSRPVLMTAGMARAA